MSKRNKNKDKNKNRDLKKTLKQVKEERDQYLENWQRAQADFENYKKDEKKRLQEFRNWIKKEFVSKLIPILDSFNEALSSEGQKSEKESWLEGIMSIRDQIFSVLKQEGIELIEPEKGDEFDPRFHEIVANSEECDEKIREVVQPGYKLEDVVLRPARVKLKKQ